MEKLKVIFHVNEAGKWDVAIGNVTNLLNDTGDDAVEPVILANGPSVEAFTNTAQVETMKALASRGVIFLACRNSLKKLCSQSSACISEEFLPKFIRVVPSGVTELVRRQAAGFAYIKP
ncbi:MAG: DsrE family protein [Nitrospirae bacterium]|nr:DsrE family protein [Nitrospirota bacterium]